MTLSDNPSVSFSDIMSTVASNFGLNTGSAEWEVETTAIDIRNDFFRVSNMQGVGFPDVSGKPITIPDPTRCPENLTYFTFCSIVSILTACKYGPFTTNFRRVSADFVWIE